MTRTMTPQQARELAKTSLSEARFYHTECVAKAAEELAERYHVDVDNALIAAYLHDILKEHDRADLLQRMQGSAIILSTQMIDSPAIWHAYAGGCYVKEELGLSDDIANAVMYHTAGRADMSLLEKIIFVADFISEDRAFSGVSEVRALAQASLDEACIVALHNSIIHICKQYKPIDPHTVEAFNALLHHRSNR